MEVYARTNCWQRVKSSHKYTGKDDDHFRTSLCRKCHTAYLGREDKTVAQLRYMADSKYDARSFQRNMSNTMVVHKVVEAYRNLREERGLLGH